MKNELKVISFFKKLFIPVYSKKQVDEIIDRYEHYCAEYENNAEDYKKNIGRLSNLIKNQKVAIEKYEIKNKKLEEKVEIAKEFEKTVDELLKENSEKSKEIENIIKTNNDRINNLKRTHAKEIEDILKKQVNPKNNESTSKLKKMIKDLEEEVIELKNKIKMTGSRVLTCKQAYGILTYLKEGKAIVDIASQYGINKSTVNRIKNGQTYKDCIKKFKEEQVKPPIDPHDGEDL